MVNNKISNMEVYLKLLSILFFIIGVLSIFTGFMMIVVIKFSNLPQSVFERSFLFRHYGELALFEFILGISVVISAFYFKRKIKWARTFFEILTWLYLFYIIIFFLFGLFDIFSKGDLFLGAKIGMVAMIFVGCLFFGGIGVFVLTILRKREFLSLFNGNNE